MQHLSMTHTIAAIAGKAQAQNLPVESGEVSAETPKAKFAEFLWPERSDQDEQATNAPVLEEEGPSTVSPDEATDTAVLGDVDISTTSALPAETHDSSDDAASDDIFLTRHQQRAVPAPPAATAQATGPLPSTSVNNQPNTPEDARSFNNATHPDTEPSNPALREMAALPGKARGSADMATTPALPDGGGAKSKDTFADQDLKAERAQQALGQTGDRAIQPNPDPLMTAASKEPLASLPTPKVDLARTTGDTQSASKARPASGIDAVESSLRGTMAQSPQPKLETPGVVAAQTSSTHVAINTHALVERAAQSQAGGRMGKAETSRIEKPNPDVTSQPMAPVRPSLRQMAPMNLPPATAAPVNTDPNVERFPVEASPISDLRLTGEPGTLRATPDNPMTRPELPRHMAMQLADAAQRGGAGRPVDLVLNPVELGRVKISLQTTDGTVVVQVSAERPETLDLMRRNAEVLAQEFHNIGYGEAQFSFSQQNSGDADPDQNSDQASGRSATSDGMTGSELPEAPTLTSIITDRVDIRV